MATIVYGDTSGSLTDHQEGGHNTLVGPDNTDSSIYGDAVVAMTDFATGFG